MSPIPAEIPTLLARLRLAEPEARQAQEALFALGEPAIAPLRAALIEAEDPHVQRRVATVLGWIGGRAVRALLIDAAASGSVHADVRPIAVRAALDEAVPDDARSVLGPLMALATDPDYFVRAATCAGLARSGDDRAAALLQRMVGDPEKLVREAATASLAADAGAKPVGRGGTRREKAPRPGPASAAPRDPADLLRSAPDAAGRDRAIREILRLGARAGAVFASAMDDPRAAVRLAAVRGLLRQPDPRQQEVLRAAVENDANADVRGLAAQALSVIIEPQDGVRLGAAFLRWTSDRDAWVRAAAATCVGIACNELRAGDRLLALFEDPEDRVVLAAAEGTLTFARNHDMDGWSKAVRKAIGTLAHRGPTPPSEQTIVALLDVVRELTGPREASLAAHAARIFLAFGPAIRAAALGVLVAAAARSEPDVEITALLLKLLDEDDDPGVRRTVLQALTGGATLLGASGVGRIANLVRGADEDEDVALAAVDVLARCVGLASAEALIGFASTPDGAEVGSAVAAAARQVLASWSEDGAIRVRKRTDGSYIAERVLRCARDTTELDVVPGDGGETLRCPRCATEHALAARDRPVPLEDAPLGVCWCETCRRRRVLIQGATGLRCPASSETYVRAPETAELLRVAELPYGLCCCCESPRPLVARRSGPDGGEESEPQVVCARTSKPHARDASGRYTPVAPLPEVDGSAIDRALLAGSLQVGRSGVASAPSDDDEL